MVSEARVEDRGARALACLDAILAQEPEPEPALFSHATQQLSAFRDALIAERGKRVRLDHVNAVISVVLAGHFPLGKVPWPELHKARDWLAAAIR